MQLTGKEINRNNKVSLGVTVFSFMVLLLFLMFKNIIGSNPNLANVNQIEVNMVPGDENPYNFSNEMKTKGLIAEKKENASQKKEVTVSDEQINAFNNMTNELLEKYKRSSQINANPPSSNEEAASPGTITESSLLTDNRTGDPTLGFNLEKRQLLYEPKFANDTREEGKVIVEIIVDKVGNVIEANPNGRGTTTNNAKLKTRAKQMALESKFSPAPTVEEQRGTITINFSFH